MYINTTGTLGVASAAYWWGRLAGSAVRLQHYIDGTLYPLWVLLVADDLIAISTRPTFRRALLLVFLVLDGLGFPLSWNKDCVAPVLKWVEGPSWASRPRGSSGSRTGWSASSRNASSEWGTSPKSWAGAPSSTAPWALSGATLQLRRSLLPGLRQAPSALRLGHTAPPSQQTERAEALPLRDPEDVVAASLARRCACQRRGRRHWVVRSRRPR